MIGKTLQQALQQDGYAVDWVNDGAGRPGSRSTPPPDAYALVLLDLGLPRKSGLDLLKEIRRAGNKVRVLIVTARDAVADRVAGLDAGADDYLVKPFSLDELRRADARAAAARRRPRGQRAAPRRPRARHGGAHRHAAAVRRSSCRRASSRCWPRCSSGPGAALSKAQLEERSTAGATKWRATPSRCTSTTCAEARRRRDPHDPRRRLRARLTRRRAR